MRRALVAGIVAASVAAMPVVPASAAETASDGDATAGLILLLSTTGLIALAGIGSYALTSKDKGGGHAARYLRDNAANVNQGIALGSGPVVEDLAVVFGVGDGRRAAFVRGLRAARRELLGLADPKGLTDERATQFFDHVRLIAAST